MRFAIALVLLLGTTVLPASAQKAESDKGPDTRKVEAPAPKDKDADHLSVTEHHQITVHGQPLQYKATAGTLVVRDDAGKPIANMFFVAYEKEPKESAATRPLTFLFNGGPGSSSVWLHLGAAGPKRVGIDDNGDRPSPPY